MTFPITPRSRGGRRSLARSPSTRAHARPRAYILIDSSGLAVHVGQLRRPPKNRDYRKLHLCVDEQTGQIVASEDEQTFSAMRRESSRSSARSTGPSHRSERKSAYDASCVYEVLEKHCAHRSPRVLIPPRRGAQLAPESSTTRERNRNIRGRARVGKRVS